MTNDDFQNKVVAPMVAEMQNIFATKGLDYAGEADRLANFKRIAAKLGISPLQVWGVYFLKHVDAIETFIRTGVLKGEPFKSKIQDVFVYAPLGLGLVDEHELEDIPF